MINPRTITGKVDPHIEKILHWKTVSSLGYTVKLKKAVDTAAMNFLHTAGDVTQSLSCKVKPRYTVTTNKAWTLVNLMLWHTLLSVKPFFTANINTFHPHFAHMGMKYNQ